MRRACINEPLMPQDGQLERPPLVVRVRKVIAHLRRTVKSFGRFRYHGDAADADSPDDFSLMGVTAHI